MGIRESLKEQQDELNLKNLVPEQEVEKKDPNIIVVEEMCRKIWEKRDKIKKELAQDFSRQDIGMSTLSYEIAITKIESLHILFPEQKDFLEEIKSSYLIKDKILGLLAEIPQYTEGYLEISKSPDLKHDPDLQNDQQIYYSALLDCISIVKSCVTIAPDILTPKIKKEINDAISDIIARPELTLAAKIKLAAAHKIIFPNQQPIINLESEIDSYIIKQKELISSTLHDQAYLLPHISLSDFADIKIMFPDKFQELGMTENFFKQIEKQIVKYTDIENAASLMILVAKEIRITDHGLELTMPEKKESHQQTIPPRPERRT